MNILIIGMKVISMKKWLEEDKGCHFPRGISEPQNHRLVQDYLFQEIQHRGPKDKLHELRKLRNKADYNLDIQLTTREAQRAISLAENILRYTSI